MAQCLPFYSYCSSLTTGCYLYTNPKRTATVEAGWISDGTTSYQVNSSGMIIGTSNCVFNYRAYHLQSNGYAGTIYWKDCNGTTQSEYNYGAGWSTVVPCALEGSFTYSGSANFGAYMDIGFPCDCNNINTCESYTITSSRTGPGTGSVYYINCNGGWNNVAGPAYGQSITICARKGSVWNLATNDNIGQITNQGVTGYTGGGTRGIVDNGACYPAYGTYLNSQCVDCDLYAFRANGSGGSYQAEVLQYNTSACCYTGGGGGGGGGGSFE
jgi:hypothetical protein